MDPSDLRLDRGARSELLDQHLPALLDATLAALDLAVVVTDTSGRIQLWNNAAEETFGWSATEALGETIGRVVVGPDGGPVPLVDSAGHSLGGEVICRRRDGRNVPVSTTTAAIRDRHGDLRGMVTIAGDASDRLAVDREIRKHHAIAASSADAVLTVQHGRITSWSPAASRLFGWSAEEAEGLLVAELLPPGGDDAILALRRAVLGGEGIRDHAIEVRTRDGGLVPVSIDITPVYDDAAANWVSVVTIRDHRGRDEVIEAAVVAEAQSRMLLAQSNEVVAVVDADGTIRAVSSAVTAKIGLDPSEVVGRRAHDLIHPADLPLVDAALAACANGDPLPPVVHRRLDPGGEPRWVESRLTNLLDDPVIAGIVVSITDVHQREVALAELAAREARFSAVLDRSSDVGVFADRHGVVQWVSPAVRDVLGLEPDALIGSAGFAFIHPSDEEVAAGAYADVLGTPGSHATVEFRVVDRHGAERWVECVSTNLLDEPDVGFVVSNLRDITERRQAHDQLARLALVDDLTELANRNALVEFTRLVLDRSTEDQPCALVFFDVDDFADVNDALGHRAGDALLVSIARRVEHSLPAGSTLGRFGGNQFAVLCDGAVARPGAPAHLAVTATVHDAFEAPFVVDGNELFVGASIGVAVAPPGDVDALMRRADTALYRAKRAGRSRTVVFEAELGTDSRRRLDYGRELRRALERREIVPHYQPVVDLATGRVVAVEALARWDHPERGRVTPDVFIPLAEETGLVSELGRSILEQACRDAASWTGDRPLDVAVNASAVQVMDPCFPDVVLGVVEETGLAVERLVIEITETAALRDMAAASATLERLHRSGVRLSLDDFGTGYSSLSFLKRLPVVNVKIDRSFVGGLGRSEDDEQIVRGVAGLAVALGFDVVAEGVESREQAALARAYGCALGQGFLWSPAVPAAQLAETVERIERRG